MIKPLPHWALTDLQPAFYDTESVTAIQMVAKLYAKMQDLITDYNGFIDEINQAIKDFEEGILQDFECFKNKITEILNNYIQSIDLKIQTQDAKIDDFIEYTTTTINDKFTEQDTTIDTRLNAQDTLIDTRLDTQDSIIADAVDYMKTNLVSIVTNLFNQVIADREISLELGIDYNANTENLQIGVIPIVEEEEY